MKRFLALAAPLAIALHINVAHAQDTVSEFDRKTARDLYFEGDKLQQSGKYVEAIERFQRSFGVVKAPTSLLHIAQCQVGAGKLVEAEESYRALSQLALAPNAPAPFAQAKITGATEAQQLAPRIPSLRIDVNPANVPGLIVTIDDQPISPSLVGADRAVNPGVHKITAVAPNFAKAEATVDVRERAKERAKLELRADATSQPQQTYPLQTQPQQTYPQQTQPQQTYPQQTQPQPTYPQQTYPQQGGYQQQGYGPQPGQPGYVAPEPYRSKMSIMAGVNLGLDYIYGDSTCGTGTSTCSAFAYGAQVDFRFLRNFTAELGAHIHSETLSDSSGIDYSDTLITTNLFAGYITSPHASFGFWPQAGLIVQTRSGSASTTVGGTTTSYGGSASEAGFGLSLGVHVTFNNVRIVPRIDLDLSHQIGYLSIGILWDLDLDKPAAGPGY